MTISRTIAGTTVALFGCWGCTPTLDTADQVHDLRLLAMRAEPPEVIVEGENGIPSSVMQSPPIVITCLVADPMGGGRSVHYVFSTCAKVDTGSESLVDSSTHRCLPDSLDYRVLEEGNFVPGTSGEIQITFTPASHLLRDAKAKDSYDGFGGLPLPVQLELTAGAEYVVGYKRIVYSAPITSPPQPPNTNPQMLGLTVDGQSWAERADLPLARAEHVFLPQPDPSLIESYDRLTFDLQLLHFQENWRYAFFTTQGKFKNPTTGGISNRTGEQISLDNTWTPPDSPASGSVTFWVVVQDGRGGESWIVRHAELN